MHYAPQGQAGHSVQELARHGGAVLLYYPVCYLAFEGPHRLGVYGPYLELAVLDDYVGIVLALLVLADIAVVAEIGLEVQVQASREDEAEYLLSRPVGLTIKFSLGCGKLGYIELLQEFHRPPAVNWLSPVCQQKRAGHIIVDAADDGATEPGG